MAPPYSLSVDGFESQWATNHLGHFQLTRILLPQLLASKDGGVVVNLCSQGHRMYGINWDDVNLESEPHSGDTFWPGYGQSKTANILHALALKKRVHKAFSVNPGAVNSNLTKENTYADIDSLSKCIACLYSG